MHLEEQPALRYQVQKYSVVVAKNVGVPVAAVPVQSLPSAAM
jgi:hypothetical protein